MARSALCAYLYGGERYRGRSCDEVGGARVRMDGFGLRKRRGSDQERSVGSGVQIRSNQLLIRIVQGKGAVKKKRQRATVVIVSTRLSESCCCKSEVSVHVRATLS